MANLVLYRKYRPKTFAEVMGQEHIVQTITNAISSGMTSHAYLFSGPRGSGKTTLARLLAKAVNCENLQGFEPCNKCLSCLEINEARAIDLIEIDAASNRGIDDIRELKSGIGFAPTRLKYKVFIIDESHQLSKDAANALLKILEEPPSHAIFVLATTEIHKMIPTIISRCQRFDFRKLTLPEIVKKLESIIKSEKAKAEKSALELIALHSEGAMRDAESLLDQVLTFSKTSGGKEAIKAEDIKELLGIVDIKLISEFVDFLSQKKSGEAVDFLNRTLEKGYDPQEFIKTLIRYLRQALLLKISSADSSEKSQAFINPIVIGLTKEEQQKLKEQSANFTEKEFHSALNLFLEAENRMKYSSIPQLPIELAIIELINLKN